MSNSVHHQQTLKRYNALQEATIQLISVEQPADLLKFIVEKGVELLECDAGSLYLKIDDKTAKFAVVCNHSLLQKFEPQNISIQGNGIAAYVFQTGKELLISDVYQLPLNCPYRFNDEFDKANRYRSRSVLATPLINSRGELVGVLQLINRKHSVAEKWPSGDPIAIQKMPEFSPDDLLFIRSFAAVAAASLEKSRLIENIDQLFKGFIKASIQVIEERDPATRGHSERVATLSFELAKKIHESQSEKVRNISFTSKQLEELRYAGLLHDFGKVSVKESVLHKGNKLYEIEELKIRSRINRFTHAAEVGAYREYLKTLVKTGEAPDELALARLEKRTHSLREQFESYWLKIGELNQPNILSEDKSRELKKLQELKFVMPEGNTQDLLEPFEIKALSIAKGSLSNEERIQIENHVTSTFEFLRQIPWTQDFSQVTEIAYCHHEKLDGSGYPRKLKAENIPLQSRIMTICDIFDALIASDRPYKKAVPLNKVLDILVQEAKMGKLDSRFLEIFIEAEVYKMVDFNQYPKFQNAG